MKTKTQRKKRTKRERAVAIAKDVLRQLKILNVAKGTYLRNTAVELPEGFDYGDSAKKHIQKIARECRVCALGACMISHVKLFNEFTLGDFAIHMANTLETPENKNNGYFTVELNDGIMRERLAKHFSVRDLGIIESIFEMSDHFANRAKNGKPIASRVTALAAEIYGSTFDDSTERLREIMKNVIRNKGKIVIPKQFYSEARKELASR